ncbi:hypothetical protein [Nocardioides sp. Soil796]|nr:hypothetical protein [Nocardioides sp. Soil796]
MTSAIHYRFAEILNEAYPEIADTEFADLVDACVERHLSAFAETV